MAGIQRHEPAEDVLRRAGMELLVGNGADQRFVRVARRDGEGPIRSINAAKAGSADAKCAQAGCTID